MRTVQDYFETELNKIIVRSKATKAEFEKRDRRVLKYLKAMRDNQGARKDLNRFCDEIVDLELCNEQRLTEI